MKPKRIWANLSSKNLQRTNEFYSALGFKSNNPHNSQELTSFFFGENDFIIHFFTEERFNTDINGIKANANGNEIIFSLSAESKEEVDGWVEKVEKAGGSIYTPPTAVGKGYTFGFSDPDGHKFNILYWPKN